MIDGRAKSDAGMRGGGAGSIAGAGSIVAAARVDPAVNIATAVSNARTAAVLA